MPISDCEVRDPRIRRTRKLLQSALVELLKTRSFEEISVQEIAEAATINRATFYDHYADKFALLEALIAGGFHQLLQARSVEFDGSCPGRAAAVITAACDYLADSAARRACCDRRSMMEPLEDAAMLAAIRRVLEQGIQTQGGASPEEARMRAAAASGAIYGAIKEWLSTPDRSPTEQVVPQIVRLAGPLLAGPSVGLPELEAEERQAVMSAAD